MDEAYASTNGLWLGDLVLLNGEVDLLFGIFAVYHRVLTKQEVTLEEFAVRIEKFDEFGPTAAGQVREVLQNAASRN